MPTGPLVPRERKRMMWSKSGDGSMREMRERSCLFSDYGRSILGLKLSPWTMSALVLRPGRHLL